jgi:hypothetical protein
VDDRFWDRDNQNQSIDTVFRLQGVVIGTQATAERIQREYQVNSIAI